MSCYGVVFRSELTRVVILVVRDDQIGPIVHRPTLRVFCETAIALPRWVSEHATTCQLHKGGPAGRVATQHVSRRTR